MKYIATAFSLVFLSLTANASSDVLVYSQRLDRQHQSGMSYEVKRDLGRAWINLKFWQSPISEDDNNEWSEPAVVPGLSYSPESRSIVFKQDDGTTVVCATLVRHKFIFSWTSIDATGNCGVTRSEEVAKVIDDGTVPYEVTYLNTYFGVIPPGRRGD